VYALPSDAIAGKFGSNIKCMRRRHRRFLALLDCAVFQPGACAPADPILREDGRKGTGRRATPRKT
jgi:hypothetical protein